MLTQDRVKLMLTWGWLGCQIGVEARQVVKRTLHGIGQVTD